VQAAGRAGAGTSLDNAMRFGPEPGNGLDPRRLRPVLHGGRLRPRRGKIWSTDGTLLAIASQTATLLLFD